MIIGTFIRRQVGAAFITHDLTDVHAEVITREQPIYVVREATEAEWVAYVKEAGGTIPQFRDRSGAYYYEVSTD